MAYQIMCVLRPVQLAFLAQIYIRSFLFATKFFRIAGMPGEYINVKRFFFVRFVLSCGAIVLRLMPRYDFLKVAFGESAWL